MFVRAGAFHINLDLLSHVEARGSALHLHFVGPPALEERSLALTGSNREILLKALAEVDQEPGRRNDVYKRESRFVASHGDLARASPATPARL